MSNQDITAINEKVKKESSFLEGIMMEMQIPLAIRMIS